MDFLAIQFPFFAGGFSEPTLPSVVELPLSGESQDHFIQFPELLNKKGFSRKQACAGAVI